MKNRLVQCLKQISEKSHLYKKKPNRPAEVQKRCSLYYCTQMKYAVQGSIILKPHRARRRRQTQRTNPRVIFILDSKHSQWLQKSLAFSKRSIRALYINDCCVLVITMLFIPTHGQLLRYSSTSQDGTPVTAQSSRPWKTTQSSRPWKSGEGSEFLLYTILGTNTMAIVYPFEHSSVWSFILEHEKK